MSKKYIICKFSEKWDQRLVFCYYAVLNEQVTRRFYTLLIYNFVIILEHCIRLHLTAKHYFKLYIYVETTHTVPISYCQ